MDDASGRTEPALNQPRQGPCGRCHSTVLWIPTEASQGEKVMPIDIDITDDGLCFMVPAGDGSGGQWVRVIGYHAPVPPELESESRWTSHIWSCPGNTWQQKGKIGR